MNAPSEQLNAPGQTALPWIVPNRPANPISSVKHHLRLALTLAISMILLGLAIAMLYGQAKYSATATIRVLPTYDTRLLAGIEPSMLPNIDYRNFVQQQVFEIDNPQTMIDALRLLGPKVSAWQMPNETLQHAAERLADAVKVEWVSDTFLITLSLEGKRPQGLDLIVNTVVDAYLNRQEKEDLTGSDTRAALLLQRRAALQEKADAERQRLSQFAQDLGVSTFAAANTDPYDKTLADANAALDRQRRSLIERQARLDALQAEQASPSDADVNALAQKILLNNPDLAAEKTQLQKQREDTFLQLQGLSSTHPGRPALERQIADIDGEINHLDAKAATRARAIVVGTRSADVRDKIAAAQTGVDEAQRATTGIEQEVTTLKASVASFSAKYNEAMVAHEQFENHIKEISEIDDRIGLLKLQRESPGVAGLELPASLPDKPQGGKRKEIFALAILLAILLSAGVPTLADLTDPRVKSSRELEALLRMPVLGGHLDGAARSDLETLRRIALSILRERRQAGTRVFVITAAAAGAGTTTLTLDLANELSVLGASAVAVEANALSPDIRYRERAVPAPDFLRESPNGSRLPNGKPPCNSPGTAIAKRKPLGTCVHSIMAAANSLPDRMSIRPLQKDQRLSMRCVQEALELGLASHDLVLLDAPPVLTSADTAMLVQNPAGVIVVVRSNRDRLADVAAAVEELSQLSPPVVGVVIRHHQLTQAGGAGPDQTPREELRLVAKAAELPLPGKAAADFTTYA
jgi:polysaccharide biosynthesis transport protein